MWVGEKYIHGGILYKFMKDPQLDSGEFIYGKRIACDDLAAKVAAIACISFPPLSPCGVYRPVDTRFARLSFTMMLWRRII